MPCYTVQQVSVEFSIKNVDLLHDAVKSLGLNWYKAGNYVTIDYDISINLKTGYASYPRNLKQRAEQTLALVKKQYSIEAIARAATKTGWSKQQIARLNARRGVNKITVTRR